MNTITKIAFVAHEANRAWCKINGDLSQLSWNDAPNWQQESAQAGVRFHMENPNAGDSASHDSWMAQKAADGWVWGEVKDPEANPPTHPCMVPFDQLPEVDQLKDALFRATIHALLGTQPGVNTMSKTQVTDVGFNPNGNAKIHQIKVAANLMADEILELPSGRRRATSLQYLETASMWAVKAAAVGDA